jgi:hypothetical protein
MNTYVHSVGKTRPTKNTYGPRFSSLLPAGSHGISLAAYEIDIVCNDPYFRVIGEDFMKDILTMLLATVFVLVSLIVLLSAASAPDPTSWTLDNDQQRVSDVGLRLAFKR